jgi:glycerophosphoryl diester phosphodiesterase
MPEYKVYWLTSSKIPQRDKKGEVIANAKWLPITPEYVIEKLKYMNADGVDINFKRDIITKDFVNKVKSAGYEFHVWTIDDLGTAAVAFRRGADTVTTNRALEMRSDFLNLVDMTKNCKIK